MLQNRRSQRHRFAFELATVCLSDFIDCFAFIDLLRDAQSVGLRPFDIMLEAKAKDLALLRLREQIGQFAPELDGCIG